MAANGLIIVLHEKQPHNQFASNGWKQTSGGRTKLVENTLRDSYEQWRLEGRTEAKHQTLTRSDKEKLPFMAETK